MTNKKQFKNKILNFFKNLDLSQLDQKEGIVHIQPNVNLKEYVACVGCWLSYILGLPDEENTKYKKYYYRTGRRGFDTCIKKLYGISDPKVLDILLHFSGAPEYPWSRDEWDEHPYTVLKRFFEVLEYTN